MDTIIFLKYQFYSDILGEIFCTKIRSVLWNRILYLYELFIENMILQKTVCLQQVVLEHILECQAEVLPSSFRNILAEIFVML